MPSKGSRTNQGRSTEAKVLVFIIQFYDRHHYPPTLSEIAAGVGLWSKSAAWQHTRRLIRNGWLAEERSTQRQRTRAYRPLYVEVRPLLLATER